MSFVQCDKSRCVGCLTCVVTCIDHHYAETETEAVSLRRYENEVSPRTGMMSYKTRSCLHCKEPRCMEVCPADVYYRDWDGFVKMHQESCIGCRRCQEACPIGAIAFDKEGHALKCDGCFERVARGLEPACVKACPMDALRLAD